MGRVNEVMVDRPWKPDPVDHPEPHQRAGARDAHRVLGLEPVQQRHVRSGARRRGHRGCRGRCDFEDHVVGGHRAAGREPSAGLATEQRRGRQHRQAEAELQGRHGQLERFAGGAGERGRAAREGERQHGAEHNPGERRRDCEHGRSGCPGTHRADPGSSGHSSTQGARDTAEQERGERDRTAFAQCGDQELAP